jgi:hypothetical protein
MFLRPAAGTLQFRLPLDVFHRSRRINLAGAPVAQLDRASAFEIEANSIQVVAAVALVSFGPSLGCSKAAPRFVGERMILSDL